MNKLFMGYIRGLVDYSNLCRGCFKRNVEMCKTTVGCLEEEPKVGKWREKSGSGRSNREVGRGN